LSYFDSHKNTELFVDASKFSIGAVLQQVDDRGDLWEIKFKVHTIRNNNYGKSL
jgi:hypothetical protein